MVSEGDLPVAGGRRTDEWMREMREKGERGMRGTTLIVRSPVRPWSKYGRTGTGFRLTISGCVAGDWNRPAKHRTMHFNRS